MSSEGELTITYANGDVEKIQIPESPPAPTVVLEISDKQIDRLAKAFADAFAKAISS